MKKQAQGRDALTETWNGHTRGLGLVATIVIRALLPYDSENE